MMDFRGLRYRGLALNQGLLSQAGRRDVSAWLGQAFVWARGEPSASMPSLASKNTSFGMHRSPTLHWSSDLHRSPILGGSPTLAEHLLN